MRARPHLLRGRVTARRSRAALRGTLPWWCTVVARLSPAAAGAPWKPQKRVCGLVGAPLRFGGLHPGAYCGGSCCRAGSLQVREWTGNAPLRLALIPTTHACRGWVDERSRRSCFAYTRQDGLRRMAAQLHRPCYTPCQQLDSTFMHTGSGAPTQPRWPVCLCPSAKVPRHAPPPPPRALPPRTAPPRRLPALAEQRPAVAPRRLYERLQAPLQLQKVGCQLLRVLLRPRKAGGWGGGGHTVGRGRGKESKGWWGRIGSEQGDQCSCSSNQQRRAHKLGTWAHLRHEPPRLCCVRLARCDQGPHLPPGAQVGRHARRRAVR